MSYSTVVRLRFPHSVPFHPASTPSPGFLSWRQAETLLFKGHEAPDFRERDSDAVSTAFYAQGLWLEFVRRLDAPGPPSRRRGPRLVNWAAVLRGHWLTTASPQTPLKLPPWFESPSGLCWWWWWFWGIWGGAFSGGCVFALLFRAAPAA